MPTLCVQCSLRALVQGKPSPMFEEEPDEHMRLFHPDPVADVIERIELEKKLAEMLDKANQKKGKPNV